MLNLQALEMSNKKNPDQTQDNPQTPGLDDFWYDSGAPYMCEGKNFSAAGSTCAVVNTEAELQPQFDFEMEGSDNPATTQPPTVFPTQQAVPSYMPAGLQYANITPQTQPVPAYPAMNRAPAHGTFDFHPALFQTVPYGQEHQNYPQLMYAPFRTTSLYAQTANQPVTIPQATEPPERTAHGLTQQQMIAALIDEARAESARMPQEQGNLSTQPTASQPHFQIRSATAQQPQYQAAYTGGQNILADFGQPTSQAIGQNAAPPPYTGYSLDPAQDEEGDLLFDLNPFLPQAQAQTRTQAQVQPNIAAPSYNSPQQSAPSAVSPTGAAFTQLNSLPDSRARYLLTWMASLMWKFRMTTNDPKANFETLRSRLNEEYRNHCKDKQGLNAYKKLLDLLNQMDTNGNGILTRQVMDDWALVYQENYEEYDLDNRQEPKSTGGAKRGRKPKKPVKDEEAK